MFPISKNKPPSTTINTQQPISESANPLLAYEASNVTIPEVVMTRKGILKPECLIPLHSMDMDRSLQTDVAPVRFRRMHQRSATKSGVRFLLQGRIVAAEDAVRVGDSSVQEDSIGRAEAEVATEPSYATPRAPRHVAFVDRLESMFGPGSENRGTGPKPKKVRRYFRSDEVTLRKIVWQSQKHTAKKASASKPVSTTSLSSQSSYSRTPQSQLEANGVTTTTGKRSRERADNGVELAKKIRVLDRLP